MPVSRNDHHSQFSATPRSRTRFVTRFGVSVLNVVATIETPTSHQGAARPEVKNSVVLDPARRAKKIAGRNEMTMLIPMIVQSSVVKCTLTSGARRGICLCRADLGADSRGSSSLALKGPHPLTHIAVGGVQ